MDPELLQRMVDIGKAIKAQDNRGTDAPMFAVRRLVRVYGYDSGYSDKYVWMDHQNECHIARGKLRKRLENGDTTGKCANYEQVYYKLKWRTVDWFFTEQAANDYIAANKHNLGRCKTYVVSLCRNPEMRAVRKFLMTL